jgi:hypothetical protein
LMLRLLPFQATSHWFSAAVTNGGSVGIYLLRPPLFHEMVRPTSSLWLATRRSVDGPGRRCGRCTAQNNAKNTRALHYEVLFHMAVHTIFRRRAQSAQDWIVAIAKNTAALKREKN